MNSNPFFSVLIATYNRECLLKKAISSVLNQTFQDFEIVVVDDGSTDNTEKIVQSFKDSRIKYFRQENRGCAVSRNHCLRESKGNFIALLDDDDCWKFNHLELVKIFFDIYPEAGMVYTQNEVVFADDSRRKPSHYKYKKRHIPHEERKEGFWLYDSSVFDHYLETCINATPCTVIKKSVFDKIKSYNECMSCGQDYDLFIRLANKFPVGIIKQETVKILVQPKSISESIQKEKYVKSLIISWKSIKKDCELNDSQKRIINEKLLELNKQLIDLKDGI